MSNHKHGERRMNNGREMEVIPYSGYRLPTYDAIKALRDAEGVEARDVCAHCDRYNCHGDPACDCGPDALWVPVEWVPILKLTY